CTRIFGWLYRYRNQLLAVILPLAFLPLPLIIRTEEAKCGYLLLLMGAFWCLQVLPLSITALMPVFVVPLFGIQSAKDVIHNYMR
ncbi:Solute carrier family 13 member 1, partial [Lamellibrachia satsuma]